MFATADTGVFDALIFAGCLLLQELVTTICCHVCLNSRNLTNLAHTSLMDPIDLQRSNHEILSDLYSLLSVTFSPPCAFLLPSGTASRSLLVEVPIISRQYVQKNLSRTARQELDSGSIMSSLVSITAILVFISVISVL